VANDPGTLSDPRKSFEKALAAVKRASEEGRCGAAKAARRRALAHAGRIGASGDEAGAKDATEQVSAVQMGVCRIKKKRV
jgi:hypothetical protein